MCIPTDRHLSSESTKEAFPTRTRISAILAAAVNRRRVCYLSVPAMLPPILPKLD